MKILPATTAREEFAALQAAYPGPWCDLTADLLTAERGAPSVVFMGQARQRRPVDSSKLLYSMAEAGRQLGIDPKGRLRKLISDGTISTVPSPTGPRIPRSEVLRLVQEGIPKPGAGRRRRKRRSREPLPPAEQVAAEIAAIEID